MGVLHSMQKRLIKYWKTSYLVELSGTKTLSSIPTKLGISWNGFFKENQHID